MEQSIVIKDLRQEIKDFLAMPEGAYKNHLYFQTYQGAHEYKSNLLFKDGKTYYSYYSYRIKRNKNAYYLKIAEKEGFTFDGKKVSVWFGKSINHLPCLMEVFEILKIDWFNPRFKEILTKSLFEKILTGKITNPIDYCKEYLKLCRFKDVSPKFFYKLIEESKFSRYSFMSAMEVAKDRNHYIMQLINYDEENKDYKKAHILDDIIKQAQILDRKVDFTWSYKRLKAEHEKWTIEIMNMEAENLDDKPIENMPKYETLPGMLLLDSQKKVYLEGKLMRHCVYTNYWGYVKNGSYLVYHLDDDKEVATLGINIIDKKLVFNQLYSYGNTPVSEELNTKVKNWIKNINHQISKK